MEDILRYEYRDGNKKVYPMHPFVKNWEFNEGREEEATLAHNMAKVAEKNGMSNNDMMHLFPYVMRMLKSDSAWA